MVRFNYAGSASHVRNNSWNALFPHYAEQWTSYDPNDTANCTNVTWGSLWKNEDTRDALHRKNSFHYAKILDPQVEPPLNAHPPILALLLFTAIMFCLFVPQIIDLLITAYCAGPPPPLPPPTPPPRPPSRKRLKLFHHVNLRPTAAANRRKLSKSVSLRSIHDKTLQDYVCDTRLRALKRFKEEMNAVQDASPRDSV